MKICFHRHLTHSDQRPLRLLRPLKLVQTKTAISPAADGVIGTVLKKPHPKSPHTLSEVLRQPKLLQTETAICPKR
jgi:hypothetical protein